MEHEAPDLLVVLRVCAPIGVAFGIYGIISNLPMMREVATICLLISLAVWAGPIVRRIKRRGVG